MILRSRRKNESFFARFFRRKQDSDRPATQVVCSEEEFLEELAKEASRSNRRKSDREFAVILMSVVDSSEAIRSSLIGDLNQRLRMSDTLGIYQGKLSALLPETQREGARVVANTLAKVGLLHDTKLDTDIKMYPWDDRLAAVANEMLDESERLNGPPQGDEEPVKPCSEEQVTRLSDREALTRASHFSKGRAQLPFDGYMPTPWWKRAVDIVFASTGLVLLSPVFAAAAVAISLNSRGPVFFKQMREGKDGAKFGIWKFRTMCQDAENRKQELRHKSEQDGPAFKLENDPRVTTVGKYLRKSCIDELPQLINVLRGEMSMVGPRPLPVDESLACEVWQRHRLRALPGLTCIWQVDGGRDTKFSDWMRMDMQYIQQRSFWFDLKLILKTFLVVVLHRGSV